MDAGDAEEINNSKIRYIRPFIVLVACLAVCILNIYMKLPVMTGLERLLLTIVVFYILGSFAQGKVRKYLLEAEEMARQREAQKDEEEDEEEDDEEETEESEN